MMMALAAHARFAVRAGPRRRDAAASGGRGRGQGPDASAPASPTAQITLAEAAELGCRACASRRAAAASSSARPPRRRSSAKRSACRCRTRPWRRRANRSGSTWPAAPPAPSRSCRAQHRPRSTFSTDAAVRNAMAVHAAFGGSTNLLLHIPAIAYHAGLRRPTVEDWIAVNRRVPRLVDALPNGPVGHPTVRVFLAGGVPEVMLHLRDSACSTGLPDRHRRTARSGPRLVGTFASAAAAARRAAPARTASIPIDVIMSPEQCPAARPDLDGDVSARQPGPGRLGHQKHGHRSERGRCRRRLSQGRPGAGFTTERAAIAAIKSHGPTASSPATSWC